MRLTQGNALGGLKRAAVLVRAIDEKAEQSADAQVRRETAFL